VKQWLHRLLLSHSASRSGRGGTEVAAVPRAEARWQLWQLCHEVAAVPRAEAATEMLHSKLKCNASIHSVPITHESPCTAIPFERSPTRDPFRESSCCAIPDVP
jgi:hypothetical protein